MLRLLLCSLLLLTSLIGLFAQDFAAETIVCRSGAFVLVSPLTDGMTYDYQWERSFDAGSSWLPTGGNSPELTINSPNGGIVYRLAYAANSTCLADPTCRNLTSETRLLVDIPTFSQGLVVCNGDTVFVGGQPITTAGNHETIFPTASGCDSIVRTFIQQLPAYDDFFFVDLCPGEVFRGRTFTRDTILREAFSTANGCDSTLTFEIAVAFGNNPVILGPDRICSGETTELSVSGQYAVYAWSNGENDEDAIISAGGTYGLTLTDFAGCQLALTHEIATTEISIDAVIVNGPACPGTASGAISLQASGDEELMYSIDGGSSFLLDTSFTELVAGSYELVVESADGCRAERTVELSEAPELRLDSNTPEELTIERGDSVPLIVTADFVVMEYRWSSRNFLSCTDCPDALAFPPVDMDYTLEAIAEGGCSVTRTFRIQVQDNRRLYAPTAFSPNGDDRNDRWRIFTGPQAEAITGLQIADRWGGIRYVQPETALPPAEAGWDGRDGAGRELGPGIYLYTATVRFTDGSSEIIGGEITLMR